MVESLCKAYPGKIAVSVDAKGDYVAVKGWVETSEKEVLPFCRDLVKRGVQTIVYTDISKDGMLSGPNTDMLKKLNEEVDADIIASGGVATIDHIKELMDLGVYGAITGKAIYEGTLTLAEVAALEKERKTC
jgi:phosphoribosylformimino-5-aminoimidazole carboxamide ribotide isomerase